MFTSTKQNNTSKSIISKAKGSLNWNITIAFVLSVQIISCHFLGYKITIFEKIYIFFINIIPIAKTQLFILNT